MAITLNAVGIFFHAQLNALKTDTQVLDVLKAAQAAAANGQIENVSASGFRTAGDVQQSLTELSATYINPFVGRAIHNHYPAGEYYLSEDTTTKPAYTVWQYYVLDANGLPIQRGVKFLNDPTAIVPAGGTLTWRLVSILTGPNPSPNPVRQGMGLRPGGGATSA